MGTSISPWYTTVPGMTSISIAAIADTFKVRYMYRLSAIDLYRNIAIDVGDIFSKYR